MFPVERAYYFVYAVINLVEICISPLGKNVVLLTIQSRHFNRNYLPLDLQSFRMNAKLQKLKSRIFIGGRITMKESAIQVGLSPT